MAATSLNAEQLRDAFQVFNQQSSLLEESYRDLQETVAALTSRLEREQSARLEELVKKERLGRRLSELLETLPPITLMTMGWNVFVYLLQLVLDLSVQQYALFPQAILIHHQYYLRWLDGSFE